MRRLLSLIFLQAGLAAAQPCAPLVEQSASGDSAMLRPHVNAFQACTVDETAYTLLVGQWLRSRPADAPPLLSLALGRAVTHPWISGHLMDAARSDAQWRARVARTPRARRDRLVAELLEQRAFLDRLSVPFAGSPYQVTGVSYEKVLWNEAGLPFDAQLWLRLKPRR